MDRQTRAGWVLGWAALLAGAAGGLAQAPAGEPAPSAVRILLNVKRAYASCRSYRDRGEVRVVGAIEGGSFGTSVPFTTAFVRGGAFRFELTDRGLGERESRLVLWAEGDQVRAWWEAGGGERRVESLRAALETAAGVSVGASTRVPGLLLPGEGGEGLFIAAPERLPDDEDRGVPCFRVRGKGRPTPYPLTTGSGTVTVEDEEITVWIERTTFLLRRVEERRVLSTYRTVTTTTYEPQVDVDIPAAELAFPLTPQL